MPETLVMPPEASTGPNPKDVMDSIHHLATTADRGVAIEAIGNYVAQAEADKFDPRPGETMDEYLARLEELSDPNRPPSDTPEDTARRYGQEVLAVLKVLEGHDKPVETEPQTPLPEQSVEEETIAEEMPEHQEEVTPVSNDDDEESAADDGEVDEAAEEDEEESGRYEGEEVIEIKGDDKLIIRTPPPPQPSVSTFGSEQSAVKDASEDKASARTQGQQIEQVPRNIVDELNPIDRDLWEQMSKLASRQTDGILSKELATVLDDMQHDAFDREQTNKVLEHIMGNAEELEARGDSAGAERQHRTAELLSSLSERWREPV